MSRMSCAWMARSRRDLRSSSTGDGERTDRELSRSGAGTGARRTTPMRAIAGADGVLVDNRFPEFVLPIARAAAAAGKIVVLDGDKPIRLTDELLTLATHIVFSADGLRATAGTQRSCSCACSRGARTDAFVAVTDGAARHAVAASDGVLHRLPAFRGRGRRYARRGRRLPRRFRARAGRRPGAAGRPCVSRRQRPRSNAPGSAAGRGAPATRRSGSILLVAARKTGFPVEQFSIYSGPVCPHFRIIFQVLHGCH